jgi:hypothetical protein
MMRLQGGTAGILAAIASGRLDELDARLVEERDLPAMSGSKRREILRRARRREKRLARFQPPEGGDAIDYG